MIYNDIDFSKRGVEASILSIKNDINRKIGLVELRYNDVYNAIIEENNKLVDFLNEFRAAVDTIVNECNDLQGLTDEELTEIKQRIEELKQILDSIDIPDLPKIKKPEDVFSGITEEKPDNKFTYIPIDSPNPMTGSNNPDSTAFFCGDYSASVNDGDLGDPACKANYVIWNNDMQSGACVTGYDEETYEAGRTDGFTGCMAKYEADDMNCYSGFATRVIDVETAAGEQVCISGFSAQNGTSCEADYVQDTMHRDCAVNFSNAAGENCVEEYYFDGTNVNCDKFSGYGMDCPESYAYGTGLESCSNEYKDGTITCNSKYGYTPGSQSIGSCQNGFSDGITSCEGRWQDSEVGNMSACQRNYRNGHVSCSKNYVTDGHFVYCDNRDSACRRCVNCDSCVGGANCSSCNSPSCYNCYGKSDGSSPPCGESTPCEQCPDHTPVQPCKCCHNSIGWDYFLCNANGDDT